MIRFGPPSAYNGSPKEAKFSVDDSI